MAPVQPLCQSAVSLCADPSQQPRRRVRRPRRAVAGIQVWRSGLGQRHQLHDDPAAGAEQPPDGERGGSDWNFELRPTFWFGLTLCDTESSPEFTKTCRPDSDSNDLVGSNPHAPNYIGKHPGNAFMELQFYGPGYVPQFEGFGCTAHQYCAAMTIDSRTLDQNSGVRTPPPAISTSSAARNRSLGLRHEERAVPGPGQPAVYGHVLRVRTSARSTSTRARTC